MFSEGAKIKSWFILKEKEKEFNLKAGWQRGILWTDTLTRDYLTLKI